MSNEVLTALLAFAGTAIGTLGGIVASAKLNAYRMNSLQIGGQYERF